jgi:DNA-binding GntR family transcriptional regulator
LDILINQQDDSRTLANEVYERLRADILSSKLAPGSKLRFETLKEVYGVGISPLREALSRLVGKGLITTEGQRGFRVAPASTADITDIAMVRAEVEGTALRKSIDYGDDTWEANVVAARHRLGLMEHRKSSEEISEERWEARHREFHLALISGCRSPWLVNLTVLLNDQFDRYRRLSVENSLSQKPTILEHQKIMDAALKRNADLAVKLLHEHINQALRLIVDSNADLSSD